MERSFVFNFSSMERSWYTSLVAGRRAREDTVSSSSQGYTALVQEALSFSFPTISPRHDIIGNLADPAPFNLVHIITGMRRCGKTFFTFQLIRRLLDKGVPRRHVFYFNFADDRLRPISSNMLNDIVEEYWRLVPEARTEGAYLFLDEVQEADGWQGFCQRIAEHERVTLTITGSSSKLSADEIASTFRGRSMEHRMFPLSFREYCEFHGIETPEPDALQRAGEVAPQKRTELEAAFDRYLVEGGFPGVQTLDRGQRILLLQSYMRDVVARDVVERYRRIDIDLANQVALFCLRNTGCELSINNLVESLRAVGYRTSWETINGAIRLFRQAHLLELLPEYSVSLSPDSTATNKVYAADPGMAYAVSRANQQDIGKRLETAVHGELLRRLAFSRIDALTSYTEPRTKRKVDFLVGDALGTDPYELIQVTVDMSAEKTRNREMGSLAEAMRATRLRTGTIVTLREGGDVESDYGTVSILPAWKWALLP